MAKGDKWHVEHEFAKPKEKDEEDFTPIFEEDDGSICVLVFCVNYNSLIGNFM